MLINNLNQSFNHNFTYRNWLKNIFRSKLNKSSNLLFTSSTNITSQQNNSTKENQRKKSSYQQKENCSSNENEFILSKVSKLCNLSSYLEMIRKSKQNVDNTYLFIFTDKRNAIQLPDKLNTKKFDYFTLGNKDMCLVDLDCSKEIVDSIFQPSEERLGTNRFYHVKGPFLSSKLIRDGDRPIEEIYFRNFNQSKIDLDKFKKLPNAEEQFDFLADEKKISDLERRIKFTIINYLEQNLCKGVFENFELIPFGSSFTGLGFNNTDLDLILLPKPLFSNENNPKELKEFINQNHLTYLFKRSLMDKKTINTCLNMIKNSLTLMPGIEPIIHIHAAHVPIIKAKCPVVDVDMDISMTLQAKDNGVLLMTQTLYSYASLFPILKQLYVVLRLWGSESEIIQPQPSNGLKNFTFLMLIISFLQTRYIPLLPSMKSILGGDQESILSCLNSSADVLATELIPEFFDFLIKTDFQRNSIDLYHGCLTRNLSLDPLSIKNPFDLTKPNMSKNVSKIMLTKLKRTTQYFERNFDPTNLSTLFEPNEVKDIQF